MTIERRRWYESIGKQLTSLRRVMNERIRYTDCRKVRGICICRSPASVAYAKEQAVTQIWDVLPVPPGHHLRVLARKPFASPSMPSPPTFHMIFIAWTGPVELATVKLEAQG